MLWPLGPLQASSCCGSQFQSPHASQGPGKPSASAATKARSLRTLPETSTLGSKYTPMHRKGALLTRISTTA
eukprot:7523251-Lingulodinium_polyedra.AAC.1